MFNPNRVEAARVELVRSQLAWEHRELNDDVADVTGVAATDRLEKSVDNAVVCKGEFQDISAVQNGGGLQTDRLVYAEQPQGGFKPGAMAIKRGGYPIVSETVLIYLIAEFAREMEKVRHLGQLSETGGRRSGQKELAMD